MSKTFRILLLTFLIAGISYVAGYKSAGRYDQVEKNDIKTVEKIVIKETGKTTTITRKIKDNTVTATDPPRNWRGSLQIDPFEPQNAQIGLGYRVMPNAWLEGSLRTINGGEVGIMIGVGIEF